MSSAHVACHADRLLDTILSGKPLSESFDAESAINLTFVVTACILAASEKVGEDEWWFNYLDRVESNATKTKLIMVVSCGFAVLSGSGSDGGDGAAGW